jgi:hypothetical protein
MGDRYWVVALAGDLKTLRRACMAKKLQTDWAAPTVSALLLSGAERKIHASVLAVAELNITLRELAMPSPHGC